MCRDAHTFYIKKIFFLGLLNNGNSASSTPTGFSTVKRDTWRGIGLYRRKIAQVAFRASSSSSSAAAAAASDREDVSATGWIREIFPPRAGEPHFSPLINPRVSPMLKLSGRWETARTIHHCISSSSPVSFDFSLGNCGCSRTQKRRVAPLRSASSATQRQRTADTSRRGDAMRDHLLVHFTHVRTHAS